MLLKMAAAAAELDVSTSTVIRWIRSGELEAVRIGGGTYINTHASRAFPEPSPALVTGRHQLLNPTHPYGGVWPI
jgi:excisionase family DNA binding protein